MKRRADGRYQKKITLCNGKSKTLYSNAPNERLATKDFNEQMLTLKKEIQKSLAFSVIAESWSNEHFPKLQNNTKKAYSCALKDAVNFFGNTDITSIKPIDIQRYIDKLVSDKFTAKTIKNKIIIVNLIIKYAIMNDYIELDPCTNVKIPKTMPRKKRVNADILEEEAIYKNIDKQGGILALFFLVTGCRRGEAMALTPNDIDISNKTVSISKSVEWISNAPQIKNCPKTDAGFREIPLPEKMIELLIPYMKQTYIFEGKKDSMLTHKQFRVLWNKYQEEAKITCTPHQLRHSYATMLFDAGIDIKTAQRWLGHSDIKTTLDIYTHLSECRLEKSTKTMLNYLEKKLM